MSQLFLDIHDAFLAAAARRRRGVKGLPTLAVIGKLRYLWAAPSSGETAYKRYAPYVTPEANRISCRIEEAPAAASRPWRPVLSDEDEMTLIASAAATMQWSVRRQRRTDVEN